MGNQLEFQKVYEEHAGLVRRLLYGLCHANDLDDLVQVVFVKIYENLHKVREEKALKGWVCQITVNTARDRMRSKQRGQWLRFFAEEEVDSVEEPSPRMDEKMMQRQSVDSILGKLTPKLREVVALYSLHEMEVKDIAEALNVPEGTVKSRLHSARETLKTSMEKGKTNE